MHCNSVRDFSSISCLVNAHLSLVCGSYHSILHFSKVQPEFTKLLVIRIYVMSNTIGLADDE